MKIREDRPVPQARGTVRTTIKDLLVDAAVATASEATVAGNADEARAILEMADQLFGQLAHTEDSAVTVLPARAKAPTGDNGPGADVIAPRLRLSR